MSELHPTSTWRATGLSPRDIKLQAAQLQLKLRDKVDAYCPQGHNGDTLTAAMRDRLSQLLQRFIQSHDQVLSQLTISGDLASHPWAGINNTQLDPAQFSQVSERLTEWQASLVAVSGLLASAGAELSLYLLQTLVLDMEPSWHPGFWVMAPVASAVLVALSGWWFCRAVVTAPPLYVLRQL